MATRKTDWSISGPVDPLADPPRPVEVLIVAIHLFGILEAGMQRQRWFANENIGTMAIGNGLRAPPLELGGFDQRATVNNTVDGHKAVPDPFLQNY